MKKKEKDTIIKRVSVIFFVLVSVCFGNTRKKSEIDHTNKMDGPQWNSNATPFDLGFAQSGERVNSDRIILYLFTFYKWFILLLYR